MAVRLERSEYRDTLRMPDFQTVDQALVAGVWQELGHHDIPNGLEMLMGYGQTSGQANAQGRIYASIVAAGPVAILGKARFELRNPVGRPMITLAEFDLASLTTSATDRSQQMPQPEIGEIMSERWILVFLVNVDTGATADVSICDLRLDVTVRDKVAR